MDYEILKNFNNRVNNIVLEFNLVENENTFQPIAYEDLPRVVCNEIDEIALELFDPDKGHVAVIGSSQSGKSFIINQVVGNIHRYLDKVDVDSMIFIRLKKSDMDVFMSLPGGYGTYISAICSEFECSENNVCFVTEDPTIAAHIFSMTNRARVILEASHSTFMQIAEMENQGMTKIWASWQFVDADEILLNKKDLVNLLELTLNDKMMDTFRVAADKRLINLFVNYVLKQMPELLVKDDKNRNIVSVPMGVWAVAIRRLCGIIGLSESPDIRNGSKIIMGRVIESVYKDNINLFENFLEKGTDADHLLDLLSSAGAQVIQLQGLRFDEAEMNDGAEPKKASPLVFNDMGVLSTELHKEIIGQDEAIETVVEGLVVPAAGLHDNEKPVRSFLFLGPTGVGKTRLATVLAEHVADSPMNVVRIDMSEYSQPHEAAKLLGAPPGYTGFEKGGVLTTAVAENPHSLVLLDEIEKAHPKIWDSFLQILDAGRMTDGQGRVVDFTQSIIIMTSNLGASDLSKTSTGFSAVSLSAQYSDRQKNAKNIVMKAVESNLRPEMINRIDEVIVFKELSKDTARKIVLKEIGILADRMKTVGFNLAEVDNNIVDDILTKSNVSKYGARDIQRNVLKNVSNPVARAIVKQKDSGDKNIMLVLDENKNISAVKS